MGFQLQEKMMTLNVGLLLCRPCYVYFYQTAEARIILF